jgi:hypothetical protein
MKSIIDLVSKRKAHRFVPREFVFEQLEERGDAFFGGEFRERKNERAADVVAFVLTGEEGVAKAH